jgi:DNA-binding CsgD family transcriptional regulator
LDYKSYELMLTMRYLIQKNEILTELHKQIISLKEQSSKFPVKFIRDMERIINQGLDTQTEEWKNAMNVLKLSHQGFFKRLKEKYPNLTPNDLRLSSYLRMNFTTKEIAKLLNISGRAVEISRYRLRRKLNLGHDKNLTEYLIRESENNE